MKDPFIHFLNNITLIPPEEEEKMKAIIKVLKYQKNEHYLLQGQTPNNFGFVLKGFFRYYYSDEQGNEFTKGFFPENTFLSSYSALIEKRESYFGIQALEDTEIVSIHFEKWKELLNGHRCWSEVLIAILEKGYSKKVERERQFLLFDAETRYRIFLKEFPGMEKRISQHLIASYLGITPVALSRIRRKMGVVNA